MTLAHLYTPLWVFDPDSMHVYWANEAGIRYWGADSEEELYARDMAIDMSASARKRLADIVDDCHSLNKNVRDIWTLYPAGRPSRTAEFSVSPFLIDNCVKGILCQVVTELTDARSQTLYSTTALNYTDTMISLYNSDYQMLYCNPASREAFGERCSSLTRCLINSNDISLIDESLEESEGCTLELEVMTLQGHRWHTMVFRKTLEPVSGKHAILISAADATERRYAQQVAYKLAYTDSLTGLPNRAAMKVYMEELRSEEECTPSSFGLFFLDLDRFKIINDSLGHAVGDQLLIEVAHRLKKSVGTNGLVYRLGGDEFVTIVNGQTDMEQLRFLAKTILNAMAEPVHLAEQKLRILPSIGICKFPEDGNTIPELMEHADAAMYLAKANQSGYCFYDRQMSVVLSETVKDRLGLENDLVDALKNEEFELFFQPKIASSDLSVAGVEALIRWNHPKRGLVSPDDFIMIAEETGQIFELGDWVLEAAMKQQRQWQDQGFRISVAINISPRQFQDSDFAIKVSQTLLRTGCDPSMIELEITETMLLGDTDKLIETLHQVSAMGIKLALDDFGTGYSNLAYLQKYPLDTLKIDRIFLADMKRSMLTATILEMGKVLGLNVVAEGVETSSQASWLIARGCDQLQGYYYCPPLPVRKVTEYIKRQNSKGSDKVHEAA